MIIQREFLWRWEHEGRKIARVKWECLCKFREDNVLGIKDLKLFNMGLLEK